MSLPRLDHATHIADRLNFLANIVKTRSRASLTDANHILETISLRFFNTLFGWNLINLNAELANYPAADLGDRQRRLAIQVTNAEGSDKIAHTKSKAVEHGLGSDFDRLIIFFLLPKKPGFPRNFAQPSAGPKIETWDIADLLKQLWDLPDVDALAKAAKVLEEELGRVAPAELASKFDISRILKYAPDDLIGRETELKFLDDAWAKVITGELGRPHILTFVALGGEGKTSLVAKWAVDELLAKGWPGCDAAFAWSFYSQGTRDQVAASSDLFLKEALTFFGDDDDKELAASPAGAFEKGQRLARVVGLRRSLLILDGLEPLQYAPTSPTPGELKDQGIAALVKGLAATSHGLCIVTTRYSVPDLKAFWQKTAPEVDLLRLSREAGVHLLKAFNVWGNDRKNIPLNNDKELLSEFEKLVEDVKGHALTLNLLGSYLRDAHGGDIRKRDLINFADADAANEHRHHVVHVMDAYVRWLSPSGFRSWIRRLFSQNARETQVVGKRALAVLRMVGLFDRPVTDDCLGALLKTPAVSSLTEPLVELNDAQRNTVLKRLEEAKLLTVNRDASGALVSLDAHPHLRDYFARQLRTQQPDAWRAAHRRLYEHLCATTKEGDHPTLEDLQPLYQAVAHGCHAGLQLDACNRVYFARLMRGDEYYSSRKLGAMGSNVGAIAFFCDQPWTRISPAFPEASQAWLVNEAAFYLRALGRLSESLEPMRAGLEMRVKLRDWRNASISARELSMLDSSLGDVASAVQDAGQAVVYADRSGEAFERMVSRTTHADALHQAGRRGKADGLFRESEHMQAERQSELPLLYSLQGFQYCDVLLASSERVAWQTIVQLETQITELETAAAACSAVSLRAAQTLEWAEQGGLGLLSFALHRLTLGRVELYAAILANAERGARSAEWETAGRELDATVSGLRRAGTTHWIPAGLLTRALLRFLTGARTGPDSSHEDLDEAWEIAERGPMRLHMADIHLYRARLFGMRNSEGGVRNEESKYPWESPAADLAAARKLIEKCGYWRRKEELEDAEAALAAPSNG